MEKAIKTIPVTVSKSHLVTIGERMYAESGELIRELISNAYDADATEVRISLMADKLIVDDNGSGMNERGLRQYFNIGSTFKKEFPRSPRFGRKRIGEFGIGKFAALSLCDKFEIVTRKGQYTFRVVFDKKLWGDSDSWQLPITQEPNDPFQSDGTTVVLYNLKKKLNLGEVERKIREKIPTRATYFAIFVNGNKIKPRLIPGQRFPILHRTMYGDIEGEIIIAANPALVEEAGIECRVKGVMVKREFFGLEVTHAAGVNRITGDVNADFLPITSDRTGFIVDTEEYRLFFRLVKNDLENVVKIFKKNTEERDDKKSLAALKDVLKKVKQALNLNPELWPKRLEIEKRSKRGEEAVQSIAARNHQERSKSEEVKEEKAQEHESEAAKTRPRGLVKRMRIGGLGVTVSVEHLGYEAPEAITEGKIVFINRDHPLYKKCARNKDIHFMNLARLITQEVSLMKGGISREIFDHQSKLLTDALIKREE